MNTYLTLLLLIVAGGTALVALIALSERDHRAAPARHRPDAVDRQPDDWNPLRDDVRRYLAPTFHDDVEPTFVPAGELEQTRSLLPPRPEVH